MLPGRARLRLTRLSAVLALAVAAPVLVGCEGADPASPPTPGTTVTPRAQQAQHALDELVTALRKRSQADARTAAAPPARALLAAIAGNARRLDLRQLSMTFREQQGSLTPTQRRRLGEEAWAGRAELTYRIHPLERGVARVETQVTFAPGRDGRLRVAGFGSAEDRVPLWLTGPLAVRRTDRTVVLGARPPAVERVARLARVAVEQVRDELPEWSGGLVVEVPLRQPGLDRAIDAEPGEFTRIAAVTTSADGSLRHGTPVHVFVNPQVLDGLGDRGAQVVITHETTHVALAATFADVPTWLLEGVADYVALADAGVPTETAAGQILGQIRSDGLPAGLPGPADLQPTADDLGAAYELAWLACRFLADQYGESALLRFYRRVDAGSSTQAAFRSELATTQRAFVRAWRQDLARLAGVPASNGG